MEQVTINLDEENSLTFDVQIEGSKAVTPIYRLVCDTNDMSYAFNGAASDDGVKFIVPSLQGKLIEGTHDMHLEVIIENKLFIPLQFKADFSIATRVSAATLKVENVKNKNDVSIVSAKIQTKTNVSKNDKDKTKIIESKKQITLKDLYSKKL